MIPSFKITITILLGMVFISHIPSTAQTVSLTEKKKALVQRILEEKRHLPADTSSTIKGAKTTASDDRITATGPGVEEAEISIIYDPVDPNKLILSFMHITGSAFTCEFPIYYSSDAGATWTQSSFSASAIRNSDFPSTGSNSAGDPTFAWDKTGRVYFAWIYLSDTVGFSYFTLNWAYSDDNGHTWSVAPKHFIGQGKLSSLTSLPLPYKDGITDREWLAVDNSTGPNQGNVYCSFLNVPSDTTLPPCEAIKVLKPAIDTFGPIVNAYTGFIQFGNVEVSNTGVLHVSFADVDSMQVKHTSSSDGGVSYTPSELISPAINLFPSHGGPFVVHNRENSAVNLSSDGPDGTGNNVHVVWSDFPGGTVTSYYSNSIDGGLTWSAPLDLNGLFGGQITFMPTVAADGNKVTISFTGIDGTGESNYYQFTSIDNGVTFSSPLLLSSASTYYASFPGASSAGGVFFGDYNRSIRTLKYFLPGQIIALWE